MSELQFSKQKNTEMTWTWTNWRLCWNCCRGGTEPLHYEMSLVLVERTNIFNSWRGDEEGRAVNTSTLWPGTTECDSGMWGVGWARGSGTFKLPFGAIPLLHHLKMLRARHRNTLAMQWRKKSHQLISITAHRNSTGFEKIFFVPISSHMFSLS